jgi:hypothetical protein
VREGLSSAAKARLSDAAISGSGRAPPQADSAKANISKMLANLIVLSRVLLIIVPPVGVNQGLSYVSSIPDLEGFIFALEQSMAMKKVKILIDLPLMQVGFEQLHLAQR